MGSSQSSSRWVEPGFQQQPSQSQPIPTNNANQLMNSQISFRTQQTFRFKEIKDNYSSIEQVQQALRQFGLESSELIVGIDFTKSNEWQGKTTFMGMNLHDISKGSNPYMEAIKIIARTLSVFDNDQLIPCYGFGDVTTHADAVFSFNPNDQPCRGLDMVLERYKELIPAVKMAGPTSFGPIIRQAMKIVKQNNNRYHILLLLADGEITRPSFTGQYELSDFEIDTQQAIIAASELPLSIVMIGIGDGPWGPMLEFDNKLPARKFDNFQFVEFDRLMRQVQPHARDAQFALRALMEIPEQYGIILQNHLLSPSAGASINAAAIPPPKDPPCQPQNTSVQHTNMGAQFGQQQQQQSTGVENSKQQQQQQYLQQQWQQQQQQQPQPQQQMQRAPTSPDDMFVCPITQTLMKDPVIAGDGYTYERSAIENWFKQSKQSPMTNQELNTKILIPNNNLRSKIMEMYPQQF